MAIPVENFFLDNTTQGTLQTRAVSYTHLRAHETPEQLVCRLLLEKKSHCLRKVHLTARKFKKI